MSTMTLAAIPMTLPIPLPIPPPTTRSPRPAAMSAASGVQPGPPPSPAARSLLRQADEGLRDAEAAADPAGRFIAAHLACLRAGAAVLAVRAQPDGPRRSRRAGRSVWQLLTVVAPELGEWAAFFAAGSATRAAAEAGNTRLVSRRSADDLLRQAGQFVEISRSLVCSR